MCIHGVQCKILEVLMRLAMYLMLLLTLYLGGCAVLDVSSMETAVPLSPGKIEISTYVTNGLELPSAVVLYNVPYSHSPSHDGNSNAVTTSVAGYRINVGVGKNVELFGRRYANEDSGDYWLTRCSGIRLGAKALLWKDHNMYFAVAPAINGVSGDSNSWGSLVTEVVSYNSLGWEAQFIATYAPCRYISFTAVQKYNQNNYKEVYNGHRLNAQTIKHWGTKFNVKLAYKPIFFIFEGGWETVPVVNGNKTRLDTVAVGVGVRSWDRTPKK